MKRKERNTRIFVDTLEYINQVKRKQGKRSIPLVIADMARVHREVTAGSSLYGED